MVAMAQQDLNKPETIHLPLHLDRVPMTEVTGNLNGLRAGRLAIEVNRSERIMGRIALADGLITAPGFDFIGQHVQAPFAYYIHKQSSRRQR